MCNPSQKPPEALSRFVRVLAHKAQVAGRRDRWDLPPSNHETGFLVTRDEEIPESKKRKLAAINDKRDGGRL